MGRVVILPDDVEVVRHNDLERFLAGGATPEMIAQQIGVTPTTVYNHLRKMGLQSARGRWEKRGG